jgi:hypothetical protein
LKNIEKDLKDLEKEVWSFYEMQKTFLTEPHTNKFRRILNKIKKIQTKTSTVEVEETNDNKRKG